MSQTLTLLSLEPLTQKSAAGAKAAESTQEECPVKRAAGEGEDRSWMAWCDGNETGQKLGEQRAAVRERSQLCRRQRRL